MRSRAILLFWVGSGFGFAGCGLPCLCPAATVQIILSPVPDQASVVITSASHTYTASCSTNDECHRLRFGPAEGETYSFEISASGFNDETTSAKFKREGATVCCPSMVPATVGVTLTTASAPSQ